jgi:hypothetical protein
MALMRVTTRWSGFTGAPGYSVMHFSAFEATAAAAQDAVDAVRVFFDSVKGHLPSIVSLQVLSDVEIVQEDNGQLLDIVTAPVAPLVVNGSVAGAYSAPSGAVIHWLTNTVSNGRRVRGRTFLVPLANSQYEANGTLLATTVTSITNAAVALINDLDTALVVYGRPSPNGVDGFIAAASGARVPDMACVLRSRRD